MRRIILVAWVILLSSVKSDGQRLEIYTGIVNSRVRLVQNSYKPRVGKPFSTTAWKVFPIIGYRLGFDINNSWNFGFGLDFCKIGGKDFYPYSDTLKAIFIDQEGDTIRLNHLFPRNLVLHSIRIPIFLRKEIFPWFNLDLGYSISYSFRKNFPFVFGLYPEDQVDYYNPFTHQVSGGISFDLFNYNLRVLYNYSFTYIFDTGKHFFGHFPDQYYEMKAHSQYFTITLGYLFNKYQ